MGTRTVTGERIVLPLASDGANVDGLLGASDYDHIPVTEAVELIHEHVEFYSLR